jgi:hypothetical protein
MSMEQQRLTMPEWIEKQRGNNWEYYGRVGPCYLDARIRLTNTRPSFYLWLEAPDWIDPSPALAALRDAMEASDLFEEARQVIHQPRWPRKKDCVLTGSGTSRRLLYLHMHGGGVGQTYEALVAILDKFDRLVFLAEGVRDGSAPIYRPSSLRSQAGNGEKSRRDTEGTKKGQIRDKRDNETKGQGTNPLKGCPFPSVA